MNRPLKIVAIVIGVLLVIVIAVPFFIDANAFRPRLESELTDTLGRPSKVGNLSLSLFSGGVTADNISIADDTAFSQTPFIQAKSLKVGVELIPLIFSKSLNITDLTLNQPEISLVHSREGDKWNFSSLGNTGTAQAQAKTGTTAAGTATRPSGSANSTPPPSSGSANSTSTSGSASSTPNLSIGKLKVSNGRVTVSRAGSSQQPRIYDKVDIEVSNFSFTSSFPFQRTASLPAGGSPKLEGTAGPIDASNAAHTPLQAKVSIKQMNLAASGFIDPAAGISGIAH